MIHRDDTIRLYLEKGNSLGICCKACKHMAEWTPPELERRFGDKLDLSIRDIAVRLKCPNEREGLPAHEVVVWPHFFDGEWRWQ